MRGLYTKFGWPTSRERKWAEMSPKARMEFAHTARKMCDQHNDIYLHAMVVKKQNVEEHIRKDANKLYNYMIRLSLLERMSGYDLVTIVPDARSVKVKSGNSLHDYLQTELWFTKNVKTYLSTQPLDSNQSVGVQFADMLSGIVQSRFEDGESNNFQILNP